VAKSTKNPTSEHAPKTAEAPATAAKPAESTSAVAATPKRSKSPAVPAKRAARPAKIARKTASRAIAKLPFDHPNLGLAPVNMRAGFPEAAAKLRRETAPIAARALEAAVEKDPTIETRYDEIGLRHLLRDAELLIERLAMCLGSDNPRWLVEYAEWIAPIYRRRGVSLLDICALADGIRGAAADLGADEHSAAERSLDAATAIWKRNSRLAGDRHKRNVLWKWMYRGV
jgi:hypothetical protein